ncbi:MAG: TIGR01777 family protein [Gemmataceae bacterium]
MRIAVSGSHGLIGSALVQALAQAGHEVVRLVRDGAGGTGIAWDPERGTLDRSALEGIDAVVHLAGYGIAERRWTAPVKELIRSSRVNGTRLLATALADMVRRPQVLVAASAIGYYGDRRDTWLEEDSEPGTGFLADVCRAWEAAAEPARAAGIRTVTARIGIVLSPEGGALQRMLLPFKLGLGGRIGSGQQYMSWVACDDVVAAIQFAIEQSSLAGPVNVVAPEPVTNREFTQVLARVLRRPAFLPLPSFLARLAFGEMADALLLASTRVRPRRLLEAGYTFRFPTLEAALRHLLQRPAIST